MLRDIACILIQSAHRLVPLVTHVKTVLTDIPVHMQRCWDHSIEAMQILITDYSINSSYSKFQTFCVLKDIFSLQKFSVK